MKGKETEYSAPAVGIEDHQLLPTSFIKVPDQLKPWRFSGKCLKYSKNLIRFLALSSRF